MIGVYQKKGKRHWYLRFRLHGKQHRIALHTMDEAEAISLARRILANPHLVGIEAWRVELDAYFTAQRKADRLSESAVSARRYVLCEFFRRANRPSVSLVQSQDVQAWHDALGGIEDESRQLYVRWLRTFFKHLVTQKKLRANPADGIKMNRPRPKARRGVLTKAQVATLIESCEDAELKFALFCGFHAGMRKEEVIEARPEWFDFSTPERPQVHIGPTETWIPKDREHRSVPISKAFAEFLASYGRPSPYMLAHDVTRGKARYRFDFGKRYRGHIKRCGISCTFHDARRTFASLLVSAGVSVYKVARWLGDGVGVVEQHYGHLQPDNGDLERGLG